MQSLAITWGPRWHAIQVLQRRQSLYAFYSPGVYLTITVALVASALVLHNSLRFTERNTVFVALQPLFLPILLNAVWTSIYLSITASLAASRERDKGTLEVLMYGPVDVSAFILGHFLAQLKVFSAVVLVLFVWSNLVTWLLHLKFSLEVAAVLLTSIVTAAAVIAFGLLVAAWGGRTRTALVYFVLILAVVIGIQVADEVAVQLVFETSQIANDPILLLRNALAAANNLVRWISPFAQLRLAMDALLNSSLPSYFLHLTVTLLQAGLLLGGSIFILNRKGARG